MKKITIIFLSILLLLSGCKNTDNHLFEMASPETSALALYCYDGEKVTRRWIYDTNIEREILASISKVGTKKVSNWSLEQINVPVYGLEIGGTDGMDICMAWSNGHCITQDGTVYRFKYDFENLVSDYTWEDTDIFDVAPALVLPCARFLVQDENGWNKTLLISEEEQSLPENISMTLTEQTENTLTVEFSNTGSEEWCYGEFFSLQVLVDESWYAIPAMPGNWGFNASACILPAGKKQTETYDFSMYGELPKGKYRLVVENLTVEFEL